jgi:hypothetical protein
MRLSHHAKSRSKVCLLWLASAVKALTCSNEMFQVMRSVHTDVPRSLGAKRRCVPPTYFPIHRVAYCMCFGKFARYWVGIADVMSVHEFALHSVFVR